MAAVPFYGVYDFVNRHGTGRADMERFLAESRLQVRAGRRPRPLGAGVDRSATSGRTRRRSSCSTAPTTRWCPSSRPARSSTSSARSRTQPVVYAELPGAQHAFDIFPSVRTHATVHAVERFLAVVRSEQGGPTPAEAVNATTPTG